MIKPASKFIAMGLAFAAPSSAQQARKPQPPTPPKITAVAVPRADFIKTMDLDFARMDANKDNIVTKAEIDQYQRASSLAEARAKVRALFAQLDTDKNGQLSEAEFEKMGVTTAPTNAAPILVSNDLNRDGRITLVEFRTAKLANFDRMDADKDGIVSVAEMRAAGLIK